MTTNFDRAASFYDDTRGLPEATMAALTDRLADGLGRAKEVLELGVGTGRVAVPLSERGYAMTGVDVSEKMLAVLDAKSSAVEARVGDATDLPFADASFDAVLAVDFFHLVSGWRRAVEEAARLSVLPGPVSIDELVRALNAMGVTPRDLIAILQAIKASGALDAELELM